MSDKKREKIMLKIQILKGFMQGNLNIPEKQHISDQDLAFIRQHCKTASKSDIRVCWRQLVVLLKKNWKKKFGNQ